MAATTAAWLSRLTDCFQRRRELARHPIVAVSQQTASYLTFRGAANKQRPAEHAKDCAYTDSAPSLLEEGTSAASAVKASTGEDVALAATPCVRSAVTNLVLADCTTGKTKEVWPGTATRLSHVPDL